MESEHISSELRKSVQVPGAHEDQVIIVTGYSGAGKSSVLRTLEDTGFMCVDNLPIALLGQFFGLIRDATLGSKRVALGIDIRGGDSMDLIVEALMYMKKEFPTLKILFLRASQPILMKRFQETRRKHPLADAVHLSDAIEQERIMMKPLVDRADMIFDTDQLTIHQLRSMISTTFADAQAQKIVVSLISFGFKYGIPTESNYVFDVRSLPNPYFVESLRCYSGTDARINEFLFEKQAVREYWERLIDFIRYAIAKSYEEGRCFINVAIGCTGGKHRSVAFIEKVALEKMPHTHFLLQHRDIDRE
jgi:RNase adapter protein RapZ